VRIVYMYVCARKLLGDFVDKKVDTNK